MTWKNGEHASWRSTSPSFIPSRRTRTVAGTTSLSAFAQSIGYVLAGTGPLLVGVLHGATGGWTWPFVLLFVDLGVMAVSGWCIARPRYVEDDLEAAASPQG